jgi:undecaprenyl-diphosphatase
MRWLESLILGFVQGITEFLPISSDGHLTVFQLVFDHLQGRSHSGKQNLFFDVMLHVGTMAAIIVYYRSAVLQGARGFLLNAKDVPETYRRENVLRVGLLAFVGTLPLIPDALFLKKLIEQALTSLTVTGVGFLVTAGMLFLTMNLRGGDKGPREMTWLDALLIGVAQAFAPLPGVSRSGLTITTGLLLGLKKPWAVGFSLLLAVPAIMGAAVFEIKDIDKASLASDRIAQTVAATILAGVVGYAAIAWLIRIVQSGRLWYFSVYLIVLAAVVLFVLPKLGVKRDAGQSQPVDRPVRVEVARPGALARADRPLEPLDRPLRPGARADLARPDATARGRLRPARLDLG